MSRSAYYLSTIVLALAGTSFLDGCGPSFEAEPGTTTNGDAGGTAGTGGVGGAGGAGGTAGTGVGGKGGAGAAGQPDAGHDSAAGTGGGLPEGGTDALPECSADQRYCADTTPWSCVNGHWQSGKPCEFVCDPGTASCSGECAPHSTKCSDSSSQTCNDDGYWVSTECLYVCNPTTGLCSGECVSGSKQCKEDASQTCGDDGFWKSGSPCMLGCQDGECCVSEQGSLAGNICVGCGWATAARFNCNGTRYLSTNWQDSVGEAKCITKAMCDGTDGPYWVRDMDPTDSGNTCDALCQSLNSTCTNGCTAYGGCPASTTAGYNQGEAGGTCYFSAPANGKCNSTVVQHTNAYNAACCCRGFGASVGGQNCVKTEGSAAGQVCVGCGYQVSTLFHCNGTRYTSQDYSQYSSTSECVTSAMCGGGKGPYWTRNMNGSATCDAFCASVNATCANECASFGSCAGSTNAGYNQHETYGCDSPAPKNQCSSAVAHANNAYNAFCCCRGL